VVVLLPGRMSRADEARWVAAMLQRLDAQDERRRPSDSQLLRRAEALSQRYLHGRVRPATVRWSATQNARWGSCTPSDRSIRVTTRLRGMPEWVLDYVLLHELAHLVVPTHGREFWALLEKYPRTDRARGYLEGFAAATRTAEDCD
jgi:predicted metal-dependent hydrolase